MQKYEIFRKLAANRHALTQKLKYEQATIKFFEALNEAFVVFHDSEIVLEAINNFHTNRGNAQENTIKLFKAIRKDLKIKKEFIDDSFIVTPFIPTSTSNPPKDES